MQRHAACPDDNDRCQHGDDLNCPPLAIGREVIELARKIVSRYEAGKAKDVARGYHRLDGGSLTDEVTLAQALLKLSSLL